MHRSRHFSSGFSLVDLLISAGILVFSFAGLYSFYLYGLVTLRTADNSTVANKHLAQRMNQVQRIAGWDQATSPDNLKTVFSAPITSTEQNLPGFSQESITLKTATIPYASPVPASPPTSTPTPINFTLTRKVATSGTTLTVNPTPAGSFSSTAAVTVILEIQWTDTSGHPHARQLSTILSNAGVTR